MLNLPAIIMTISYTPVQAKRVCGVVSEAMIYLLAISARIVSTTELATVTTLSKNVSDGDNVILLDVSFDQIIDANITADAVTIKLNDGGSLQINGSADVTYQLADGSKYSANQQQLGAVGKLNW